jgi:succinate-semialdehyde dehydrogenase / glutarate-semialdehyde dehydrogenase
MEPVLPPSVTKRLTAHIETAAGTVTTTAPFTGAPIADIPQCDADDVAAAYERARAAQREWAALDPERRCRIAARAGDLILDRKDEVLDILQWETGKARKHAFEEVFDAAGVTAFYARRAAKWLAPQRRRGALPGFTRTRELHHPKGVVCVITPWNYPLALGVTDAVPALLAGNAVVHKPDTQTTLALLWAIDLFTEAGLPAGVWQAVPGDPAVIGEPLVEHADHVAFTGSTATGRRIAEHAARRLIGCSLELGGKNPMLVLDDADLTRAAVGATRACFANAGQLCLSAERIYVADAVHDRFVDRLVDRVRGMRLGAELDYGVDMGSLTFARQLERVTEHVEQAREAGATVLTGGRPRPDIGPLFYEPTVLAGVTDRMAVCRAETFGPVVSVYRVRDDAEAVAMANDTDYGLNASVWSGDLGRAHRVAARIRAGTVNINEGYGAGYASYDAPMGGMKQSGLGRRHGRDGLLCYTEAQTVASQHVIRFDPPRGLPAHRHVKLLEATARTMKRLRLI